MCQAQTALAFIGTRGELSHLFIYCLSLERLPLSACAAYTIQFINVRTLTSLSRYHLYIYMVLTLAQGGVQNVVSSTEIVAAMDVPKWVSMCGKAAPLTAAGLFLAPLPTILQMAKNRTVGNKPVLPYSSMMVNAFVWFVYGMLKAEKKIWITNLFGCVLGAYYFREFRRIALRDPINLSLNKHVRGSFIIMTFTLLCALFLPKGGAEMIIGSMGIIFCVVLFGSPLSSLRHVIETKSAESIPLPFTLSTISNCFLWSVFGTLEVRDFNIYAPNMLGFGLGMFQLFVVILYGDGRQTPTNLPI